MANPIAIVTQGSEARLLQEGVHAVATAAYRDYPMEKNKIFTAIKTEKAYEIDVSISGLGLAYLKPQGTSIQVDAEKQDFVTTYTPEVYAIGTIITMEARKNNLYRDLVETAGTMIKRSLVHTDEQLAANVINNGYDSNYPLGDNEPLFSQNHVLGKGGTFANAFSVPTALSQTAVEDALIDIEDYRDGAGLLIDARAMSLHIPSALRFDADRILASRFEPASDLNAVNPVAQIFPDGYHVNHRFTSTTDWFIKTDVPNGFCEFDRDGYVFSSENEYNTENFRYKGYLWKAYGATDPRCCFGSGN